MQVVAVTFRRYAIIEDTLGYVYIKSQTRFRLAYQVVEDLSDFCEADVVLFGQVRQ
jgi:hypothetical protein